MDALDAARVIVAARYDGCDVALLAGSVVRGWRRRPRTLILWWWMRLAAPDRESFVAHGWPVEAFVNTLESYRRFFASDAERRTPSLPAMCAEGIVLCDIAMGWPSASRRRRATGWRVRAALRTRDLRRPLCAHRPAGRLHRRDAAGRGDVAAHELAVLTAEFVLAAHHAWSGRGNG